MPTQATIRRDPRNNGKGISNFHGFTVIEFMISLAVLAIITSLAVPSYRTLLEKRQVTSAAEQLKAFLSAVQIESVKRDERLAVSYSRAAADSWCVGYTTNTAGCDCTKGAADANACVVDGELRVFSDANLNHPGIMDAMTGDGGFVYDPVRGLMLDHADALTLELLSPDEHQYALNVEVIATGRVKICSKDGAGAVPGYAICS